MAAQLANGAQSINDPSSGPVLDGVRVATCATASEDPILKVCYLVQLVLFLLGITLQLRWICRQPGY